MKTDKELDRFADLFKGDVGSNRAVIPEVDMKDKDQDDPLMEFYEVKYADSEIHAISTMLEVLNRHVNRDVPGPNSEDNLKKGREAMIRCARYVLEKVCDH